MATGTRVQDGAASSDPPSLAERATRIILPVWFGLMSLVVLSPQIFMGRQLGWDAIAYTNAARTLLSGGDPWAPTSAGITYAAPPPSLLAYVAFAPLPDAVVAPVWVLIAGLSAVYAIRRLGLPGWWLLFPPVAHGIATGGTALPVLALLVHGGAVAGAAAVTLRVYAAVPLLILGRWRALGLALVVIAVTSPFLAWPAFLGDLGRISGVLTSQSDGGSSVVAIPILIPVTLVALAALGRRRAAWLLVPVLWPSSQLYYAVIALPALASAPFIAIGLAVPGAPLAVAISVMSEAVYERVAARTGWPSPRTAGSRPSPSA